MYYLADLGHTMNAKESKSCLPLPHWPAVGGDVLPSVVLQSSYDELSFRVGRDPGCGH